MKYEAKENDEIVEFEGIRYAVKEAWRSETGEGTVLARAVRLGDETVADDEYCAYLLEAAVKEDGTLEVIGDTGYEEEANGGIVGAWCWSETNGLVFHPLLDHIDLSPSREWKALIKSVMMRPGLS